jgi:hypothetical protein
MENGTHSMEHGDKNTVVGDERRMNKKRFLTIVLALFVLNVLNINMGSVVSAAPTSPYIAVVPSSDTTMIGQNHTVSIYTDYAGYDVWGWNVVLAFNTTVLQCVKVQNGDLITMDIDPSARFVSHINNTIGEVSAGAYFYYATPPPPITTSGPGTLVVVTFEVVGYAQISSLTLQDNTYLSVYDPSQNPNEPVYKIHAKVNHSQIGHGIVMVSQITGDITGPQNPPGSGIYPPDGVVNIRDLHYLGAHYGTNDPVADFTGPENPPGSGIYPPDGTVDDRDLIPLGANFGNHV